jgi:hypothetical protein
VREGRGEGAAGDARVIPAHYLYLDIDSDRAIERDRIEIYSEPTQAFEDDLRLTEGG